MCNQDFTPSERCAPRRLPTRKSVPAQIFSKTNGSHSQWTVCPDQAKTEEIEELVLIKSREIDKQKLCQWGVYTKPLTI